VMVGIAASCLPLHALHIAMPLHALHIAMPNVFVGRTAASHSLCSHSP
jgi:hypothetical protein